jgi:hypothetical protein
LKVESIEKWTRNAAAIASDLELSASAKPRRVAVVSAWAGVHCGDDHRLGWQTHALPRSRDHHLA